jgi:hypothetical protein
MRVALDEKNWAEITPVEQLTRADRVAVNAHVFFEGDAQTGNPIVRVGMDDDMAGALLERICTDWSLPFPPPSQDAKSLDRLSLVQDDKLREAIQPHITAIRGGTAPTKDNEVPTPASAS